MSGHMWEQVIKYSRHLAEIFGVECVPVNQGDQEQGENKWEPGAICRACEQCNHFGCWGMNAYRKGCEEAYRLDGIYISLCPLGLILITAPLSDETGELVGGIAAGPVCMGNPEDNFQEIYDPVLQRIVSESPCFAPEKIQSMGEIMSAVTGYISGVTHGKAGRYFYKQEHLLNAIYAEKLRKTEDTEYYTYPIALERKLRIAVRSKAVEEAQVLLNQILAYIYVSNCHNLKAIKPRLSELVVVISRAAVDAGADMNETDAMIQMFVNHIHEFESIEELSIWTTNLMQQLIAYTFNFDNVKHADVVYKAVEYIKDNYRRKITVDELAALTYVNKSYLGTIFKKETGSTIPQYINEVRVEKSKLLLLEENLSIVEIASLCGFEGQSYFTKVFREIVGMTPKKYREERGKKRFLIDKGDNL